LDQTHVSAEVISYTANVGQIDDEMDDIRPVALPAVRFRRVPWRPQADPPFYILKKV
jgi:hypothetical protein